MKVKEELYGKIQPFVDTFIEGILKIEDISVQKTEELERQILKTQDERKLLKEKETQNNKVLADNTAKLSEEKLKFQNLQKELQNEISKYVSMQNDLGGKIKENELLISGNKDTRKSIERELEIAESKRKEYEDKIASLQSDQIKINNQKKENERQKQINEAQEKENLKKEQELSKKAEELSAREVDVKLSEKNIAFAKKQLKLNE